MIKPRNDVVLVKRLVPKYEGRMVIPENAQEKPVECVVVAVGPGAYVDMPNHDCGDRRPIDLEPGDIVHVGRYSGTEIEEKGEKLLYIREAEVLGVIR